MPVSLTSQIIERTLLIEAFVSACVLFRDVLVPIAGLGGSDFPDLMPPFSAVVSREPGVAQANPAFVVHRWYTLASSAIHACTTAGVSGWSQGRKLVTRLGLEPRTQRLRDIRQGLTR